MSHVIEVDSEGVLHVPPQFLKDPTPRTRYTLEVRGETLILSPTGTAQPFWSTATPRERAESFVRWAMGHEGAPGLPDDALLREHIYE